ncbi:energy transducer TonB [Azospirillum sp. sgz301742]
MSAAAVHPDGGDLRRWTASLVVVLAAHVAGGAGVLAWRATADMAVPPSAVLIDLAPLPESAPAPPVETAAAPAPLEPPPPELLPPEPIPEPLPDLPPPPVPAPEVAVALPPRTKPRPPERPQPATKPVEPRPPVSAPAPPAAAVPAAPAPAVAAPSGAVRNWQGTVLAHLERHKRYPRAAQSRRQQGVAHVRFVIDQQGRVLSHSLEKGSGVAALDEETLAMVERADPLPAPPPDMTQPRIELVVPVVYAIK